MHGSHDLLWIPPYGRAVLVEDPALVAELRGGMRRAVPHVGVLGDHAEGRPLASSTDQDRWVRALNRLGLADGERDLEQRATATLTAEERRHLHSALRKIIKQLADVAPMSEPGDEQP